MKNFLLILLIFIYQISFSQTFDVKTILQSGSNESRINLVILSDGYQTSELNQFETDATNFSNALFAETPYKEYKNHFNVHIIKVPSNESGVNHPGTATDVSEPLHPILTVDNYFESTYDASGIHRLLVVNNSTVSNVLANNFPAYDSVLILVNSPYYGGSGGQFAVSSVHPQANQIAIHELGHSFVNLRDEYYVGDWAAAEAINMTQETNPNDVKWTNWMNKNEIGIYQHCCEGNSANWYRPHQNCKMQSLGSPFCSVCIEGTIEKIHSLTPPLITYVPQNNEIIDLSSSMNFEVTLIETIPNTLQAEWRLNGNVINSNANTILISPSDLLTGNNQLQVSIKDNTSLLQIDNHETIHVETVLWNINSTALSIDEISKNSLEIRLFPNPTQDILYFDLTNKLEENYTITISNVSSKRIITKNINYSEQHPQVDISQLPFGVYFINFRFENGLIVSSKIIKD